MAADFLARIKQSPVLCDGAMGTLLYAKGIFINRSYDELNLSQPDLIRGIHHDYLQAGAEIIETNTFGANSFRLARHSLADKVRDINRAGVRLAREAAKSFDVWVAGSVGPLGTRIEPLGKTSFQEARDAFREQIEALVEGGVDLLILETFGYLEEIHQAMLAARDVSTSLPIVAQVTIDEDGNCLDGSDPETFVPKLVEWGADVIGCNCSVGPVAMLDAMERVRAATSLPLAAQPNAGIPRSVDGRNIYLCSPEYMASYARKFVAAGVRLVGGCCGTTPEHIRVMKSALRVGEARGKTAAAHVTGGQSAPRQLRRCRCERPIAAGREAGSRRVRHHGRDRASQGDRHSQGGRGRALSEVGRRGRGQYSGQPASLGAHEQSGALAADSARSRHRRDSALHLPRPECAVHSERSAGSGRGGNQEPDLHHRRSAEDGQLSGRDRGV